MTDGPALDTAIVQTRDMQGLARFYCDGLALPDAGPSGPAHLGLEVGGVYFGFDQVAEPPGPGAVSLWFTVGDLDATFERFVALGATVRFPPTDRPWGARLAAIFDPDGNVVGLSQRKD